MIAKARSKAHGIGSGSSAHIKSEAFGMGFISGFASVGNLYSGPRKPLSEMLDPLADVLSAPILSHHSGSSYGKCFVEMGEGHSDFLKVGVEKRQGLVIKRKADSATGGTRG